jgi:hypothetical protein
MMFYDGEQFPAEYRRLLERSQPTGYKVVRVLKDGKPEGSYEHFRDYLKPRQSGAFFCSPYIGGSTASLIH